MGYRAETCDLLLDPEVALAGADAGEVVGGQGAAAVVGAWATPGGAVMRGDSAVEFCLPLLTAALEAKFGVPAANASILRTEFLTADKQKFE